MMAINLLPWRQAKREQFRRQFLSRVLAILGLALLLLLLSHLWMIKIIANQERNNLHLNYKNSVLSKQLYFFDELIIQQQNLKIQLELVNKLESDRDSAIKLLTMLVETMPDDIFLMSIKYQANTIMLTGISPSIMQINRLLNNINKFHFLQSAKIIDLKTTGNEISIKQQFVISALLVQ